MAVMLIVTVIVIPFHGRVLYRAAHPLDLPVGPWVVWLADARFRLGADHVEPHEPGMRRVANARLLTKLDAVVRQYYLDFVGLGFEHSL